MSSRLFPWFFVVAGLLLFVAFSLFTVNETEYAIRTRFGAIIDTRYLPGLHLSGPGTGSRSSIAAYCPSPTPVRPSSPTTAAGSSSIST